MFFNNLYNFKISRESDPTRRLYFVHPYSMTKLIESKTNKLKIFHISTLFKTIIQLNIINELKKYVRNVKIQLIFNKKMGNYENEF